MNSQSRSVKHREWGGNCPRALLCRNDLQNNLQNNLQKTEMTVPTLGTGDGLRVVEVVGPSLHRVSLVACLFPWWRGTKLRKLKFFHELAIRDKLDERTFVQSDVSYRSRGGRLQQSPSTEF